VLRRQYLDHMINGQLLAREAIASGVDKSPEFLQKLEDKKSDLLAIMYVDQYFKNEITSKSLKNYFEKNKSRFSKKELRASHIIVDSEKKAAEIISEAQKPNANFDDLVKKHGTPLDGALSGDLGYFSRGRMMPEFEEAAFATKKGEIHPKPVKTTFGWHVLKVVDIRGDDRVGFETVKAEVERQMKTDLQHDLLLKLRKKENVIINEDVLKATKF
jgi:peptidyl-prolyl cis-trans isomerase C